MEKKNQPAKVSYFFGPAWLKLKKFIQELWEENEKSSGKYYEKYKEKNLLSFIGVFYLMASLSIAVYSGIFTACVTLILLIMLSAVFSIEYIQYLIVWGVDRMYLIKNKIFTVCDECKSKSLLPQYQCPECKVWHSNLVPGRYGIWKRECNCGNKMPTTGFNGRGKLKSRCQSCGHSLNSNESTPICIPVVGGRSVGKTAYITAFSKTFIDEIAVNKGWTVDFYDKSKEEIYREIESDYKNGTTRMTDRAQDINKASSISFSFFVKDKMFKPDKLVHIYDVAGEVFTDNSENEIQLQYEYCHGIVFMIDPFSIPSVRNEYEGELEKEDIASIGRAEISVILDSFMNKLREVTGASSKNILEVPIAVVIGKVDIPRLKEKIGKEAAKTLKQEKPDVFYSELDAEDYLCRNFLKEYGMESFINSIDIKFKNNRYFSCSSIGHTRDKGIYTPEGVSEPMEWLFGMADSSMKKQWNDHKFGEVSTNSMGRKE